MATATKSTKSTKSTTKAKTLKVSDRATKRAAEKRAAEKAAAEQTAKNQAWRKARRLRKAMEKKGVPLTAREQKHLEELRGLQNTGRIDRNGRTMLVHYENRLGGPRSKAPKAAATTKAPKAEKLPALVEVPTTKAIGPVRPEVAQAVQQPTFIGALQVLLDAAIAAGDAQRTADLQMALRMVKRAK